MPFSPNRRRCVALAGALAGPAWAAPSRPAPPRLQLAPLGLRQRRLANGLQVVTALDRSSATVAVHESSMVIIYMLYPL